MWETIKQILKKNSGTCILIEEGKPAYVVVSFDDYQKILNNQPAAAFFEKGREITGEQEILEKINQEISNWKLRQAEENPEVEIADQNDDLKIENLPLT